LLFSVCVRVPNCWGQPEAFTPGLLGSARGLYPYLLHGGLTPTDREYEISCPRCS